MIRKIKKFVLLNATDNVLVCCQTITAEELVIIDETSYVMNTVINIGHKIARQPISKNQKVFKYGVAIGSATADIKIGEHVHMHNMKSDYIPSHTRQTVMGNK